MSIDRSRTRPDWNTLFETAAAQEGYFTTRQAADAGYLSELLVYHVKNGDLHRARRGIYRLVRYPAGEHEELVILWLWSEQQGVFSHQTALALHGLSGVLPATVHLTLPVAWKHRRFRIPDGVELHHADVPHTERSWFGPVPATSPRRTLADCAAADLSPELLRQAVDQALARGLVRKTDIAEVEQALQIFEGPTA